MALEWGVTEVRTCQPASPQDMRYHADRIRAKLELKGCSAKDRTLPSYLKLVLDSMVEKAAAIELASAAARIGVAVAGADLAAGAVAAAP
jgi:hypothetical protein